MTVVRYSSLRTLVQLILANLMTLPAVAQLEERPVNFNTEIRYYGTACFTIQRGESVLLTDPFISNPSAGKVMFGKVRTDADYVEKYINPATFRKVDLVVSGHAHYDHLMDFPYLSRHIPATTPLVANQTAKHILSYYKLPQPIVAMNDSLGTNEKIGVWTYSVDSTMRTMAFKSMHPPHIAGLNLMNKRYTQDLEAEPLLASDWQEGKTMAFMVDWLEEDSITYRIYFSSSLAQQPFGLFPKSILNEHPIDDLFISAILVRNYEDAPKPLIDLAKPKRIILMHWENLFRSKEKAAESMKEKEFDSLFKRLNDEYGNTITIIKAEPLNYY
jgi:ribonuclease BN (tRNA processing enzyme)